MTSPQRRERRSQSSRGDLSAEAITAAALELLDRGGLDDLSMRRLADDLGVTPMALYRHFRNKADLLDAVMDAAMSDVSPVAVRDDWRSRLHALAAAIRVALERHPSLVQIRLRQPLVRPSQFRFTEAAFGALIDSGLAPAEAARAFRTLFTYVFGYAAFSPGPPGGNAGRVIHAALVSLPPDEYPLLTQHAGDAVDALAGDDQFEHGLDLLLDSIAARAAAAA